MATTKPGDLGSEVPQQDPPDHSGTTEGVLPASQVGAPQEALAVTEPRPDSTSSKPPDTSRSLTDILKAIRTWVWFGAILIAGATFLWSQIPKPPKAIFVVLPNVSDYATTGNVHINDESGSPDPGQGNSVSQDLWRGISVATVRCSHDLDGTCSGCELRVGDTNDELTIEIIAVNDGPDPADTVARIDAFRKKYDCLMILGHETSTAAKAMWRSYYATQDLPVILLGPTNPDITEDDFLSGTNVLLRLLPTDDKQVALVTRIVKGDFAEPKPSTPRSVLIVTDIGNPVYGKYITERLISSLPNDVTLCGTVEVSTTSSLLPNIGRVTRLDPDVIVFVGMADAGQAFIRGLEREWSVATTEGTGVDSSTGVGSGETSAVSEWLKNVELVFTDGCASGKFCDFWNAESRQLWNHTYVITTMPPKQDFSGFDFKPTGKAAILLAKYLIVEAKRAGSVSSSALLAQFKRFRSGTEINISAAAENDKSSKKVGIVPELRILTFDTRGDNQSWPWRVYRRHAGKGFKEISPRKVQ